MTTVPPTQPPAAPEGEVRLTEAETTALSNTVRDVIGRSYGFAAICRQVERIVAERVRVVEGERDAWKSRRDAAVEQCRHLHQDGKTREQWHLDNCGAMRALAELRAGVEALADEWGESSASGHPDCAHDEDCVGCGADDLRALLAGGAS